MRVSLSLLEDQGSLEMEADKNGNYLSPFYVPNVETMWRSERKSADSPQNPFLNDKKQIQIKLLSIILNKSQTEKMGTSHDSDGMSGSSCLAMTSFSYTWEW